MGEERRRATAAGRSGESIAKQREAEEAAKLNQEMMFKALHQSPAVMVDSGAATGSMEVFRLGLTDNGTLRGVFGMARSAALNLASQIVQLNNQILAQESERVKAMSDAAMGIGQLASELAAEDQPDETAENLEPPVAAIDDAAPSSEEAAA